MDYTVRAGYDIVYDFGKKVLSKGILPTECTELKIAVDLSEEIPNIEVRTFVQCKNVDEKNSFELKSVKIKSIK